MEWRRKVRVLRSRWSNRSKLPQPREPGLRVEERGEAAQEQGEDAEGFHGDGLRGREGEPVFDAQVCHSAELGCVR